MEIVKLRSGELLDVRVSGRLDNHWSTPFDEALSEIIREGDHHVRMDMSEVNYLSSAGIAVLVKAYHELDKLKGSFVITTASDRVRTVLKLCALETLLFGTAAADAADAKTLLLPRTLASEFGTFEHYRLGGKPAECRVFGDPGRLGQGAYSEGDATTITAAQDLFALGLGALGHSYEECRELFGEFVIAGGNAAFMPTDGTSTPDYMTSSGDLVPQVQSLYGMSFRGAPAHLVRFESNNTAAIPLSEVVRACSTVAGTPEFGIVMAAEVSGLVCAILRRSPVQSDPARFDFPTVRQWLSFTPEHEHGRSSSLVVGVAAATPKNGLGPFLRPVGSQFSGHFHGAVTAFRSLARGKVQLNDVLAEMFQPRSVITVAHLLRDSRPIEGAGESELLRGACWVFPLTFAEGGAA